MVISTLERVMGFCEYSIVNMIIDQLKHSDGERVIRDQIGGLNIEQNDTIFSVQ